MIDLETMGNGPTSAIVAIGARFFDPITMEVSEPFYKTVDLADSMRYGLTVDASTICWWLQQSEEARREVYNVQDSTTLLEALTELSAYMLEGRSRNCKVWSHSTFDIPIIANAFRVVNLRVPWAYRDTADLRTLTLLSQWVRAERTGTHHNALDDVDTQIEYASKMLQQHQLKGGAEDEQSVSTGCEA